MSLRLPLFIVVALVLPLSAQKTKPSGKADNPITLRLLADEVPEGEGKVLLAMDASESVSLDLPTAALSAPIMMSARTMVLKAVDNEVSLCTISLPAEGNSFAVLLAPEKPTGYVPFVIRLDDSSFKPGDLFFINRSAAAVALKLGGTELVLEAGKAVKSRPTEPVGNAYHISISERNTAGDKLITSSRWPVGEHLRSYVVFSTSAQGKTTYRAVDESIEPADDNKAGKK